MIVVLLVFMLSMVATFGLTLVLTYDFDNFCWSDFAIWRGLEEEAVDGQTTGRVKSTS